MSTLYADNRSRRVDLEGTWADSGRQRRGLDNVDGDTPWRSLTKDATHRDATAGVPLVGDPFTHPFAADRDSLLLTDHTSSASTLVAYYDELLDQLPATAPNPVHPEPLGRALHALQAGWITLDGAARLCGVPAGVLRDDIAHNVVCLVAEATRRRPPAVRPHGQPSLFQSLDDHAAPEANLSWLLGLDTAAHAVGVDLRRLAVTWVARERARIAETNSDPDLSRLLWLRYAIWRRWTANAMLAIPALSGWGPGIRATLEVLRTELYAANVAYRQLDDQPEGDRNATLAAVGAVSLWDPLAAHTALGNLRRGVPVSIQKLKAQAGPPPLHPGGLTEGALRALCVRRGWTTSDYGDANTHRERALRPVKAVRGKRLPDGAVERWASEGDPSLIVARMEHERPLDHKTDWVHAVHDVDAAGELAYRDRLGRVVVEAITGKPVTSRSFAAAIFWRWPLTAIKWATRLRAGDIPRISGPPQLP